MQRREDKINDRYGAERNNRFMEFLSKDIQGRVSKQKNVI
jgi:hypothetical protein